MSVVGQVGSQSVASLVIGADLLLRMCGQVGVADRVAWMCNGQLPCAGVRSQAATPTWRSAVTAARRVLLVRPSASRSTALQNY
jgi:hypothetical protein